MQEPVVWMYLSGLDSPQSVDLCMCPVVVSRVCSCVFPCMQLWFPVLSLFAVKRDSFDECGSFTSSKGGCAQRTRSIAFYFMHMSVSANIDVCAPCVCTALGGQKTLDDLES